MRRRRATVATPGEWQCGVRRLAVANGPNIFQTLLVNASACQPTGDYRPYSTGQLTLTLNTNLSLFAEKLCRLQP